MEINSGIGGRGACVSFLFFLVFVLVLVLQGFSVIIPGRGFFSVSADKNEIPLKHLAVIMDGNRRWAASKGLPSWQGHREGIGAAERTIKFCLANNIKILSMYAFSLENFKRTQEEREEIFSMICEAMDIWSVNFARENVRIRFIGDRSKFPPKTLGVIDKIELETAKNSGLEVNIMFCYGGQQEIVAAAKSLAKKVKSGKLKQKDITPDVFARHMWTGGVDFPDVIIRTGRRFRLSNFMVYQAAYSEICMLDIYWPDLQMSHLEQVYQQYINSQRTFGS